MARLLDAVPSGSYLVVSHLASDIQADEMAALSKRYADDETIRETFVMRSHLEVSRFFDGLELIGPGIAPLDIWCPPTPPRADGWQNPIWGGIGRKS